MWREGDLEREFEHKKKLLDVFKKASKDIERNIAEEEIDAMIKEELMKLFERIAEDIAKKRANSVAIWIRWEDDHPKDIEWELNVGVCDCGEWATKCDACYDNAYVKGLEDGKIDCEMY